MTPDDVVSGRLPATPADLQQPLSPVENDLPVADRETPRETSEVPMTASVVVQMDPMFRPFTKAGFTGDLDQFAKDLTAYFARNVEQFADIRGADVFVGVAVIRGDEKAGHEYRSGHYVKAEEEPA